MGSFEPLIHKTKNGHTDPKWLFCCRFVHVTTAARTCALINIIGCVLLGVCLMTQKWQLVFAMLWGMLSPISVIAGIHENFPAFLMIAIIMECIETFAVGALCVFTAILGFGDYKRPYLMMYNLTSTEFGVGWGWLILLAYFVYLLWKISVYITCYKFLKRPKPLTVQEYL